MPLIPDGLVLTGTSVIWPSFRCCCCCASKGEECATMVGVVRVATITLLSQHIYSDIQTLGGCPGVALCVGVRYSRRPLEISPRSIHLVFFILYTSRRVIYPVQYCDALSHSSHTAFMMEVIPISTTSFLFLLLLLVPLLPDICFGGHCSQYTLPPVCVGAPSFVCCGSHWSA